MDRITNRDEFRGTVHPICIRCKSSTPDIIADVCNLAGRLRHQLICMSYSRSMYRVCSSRFSNLQCCICQRQAHISSNFSACEGFPTYPYIISSHVHYLHHFNHTLNFSKRLFPVIYIQPFLYITGQVLSNLRLHVHHGPYPTPASIGRGPFLRPSGLLFLHFY